MTQSMPIRYVAGRDWSTSLAHQLPVQDIKDDLLSGIHSTAILFGESKRPLVAFSAAMISLMAYSGYLQGLGWLYYVGSCGGAAAHLGWQIKTLDFKNGPRCGYLFKSNNWLGMIVWLGILLDRLYNQRRSSKSDDRPDDHRDCRLGMNTTSA